MPHALPSGTVRVLLADLDAPPLALHRLEALLAPDEAARAAQVLVPWQRARWIAGRGLLRHALGEALDRDARALRFVAGPHGRPALATTDPALPAVAFNVSHSHALLAIALAAGDAALALGVDVERWRVLHAMDGVAARVLDDAERAVLATRAGEAREATFFRLWTRKEACMKATGAGFQLPPRTFRVDADAGRQRVALPPHPCAPVGITVEVHDVDAGAGHAGAVAVGGPGGAAGWRVEVHRLEP